MILQRFIWKIRPYAGNRTTDAIVVKCGGHMLHLPVGSVVRAHLPDTECYEISSDLVPIRFGLPSASGDKVCAVRSCVISHVICEEDAESRQSTLKFSGKIPVSYLDASIRYFYKDKEDSQEDTAIGMVYPIFRESDAPVAFDAHFDPDAELDPGIPILTLVESNDYTTGFITTSGTPLLLTVIPGESQTASAWDPHTQQAYTVLTGKWKIGTASQHEDVDIMLGLSGIEFGRVKNPSVIEFVPDQPAYAPEYPVSKTNDASLLIKTFPGSEYEVTTSWVAFHTQVTQGDNGPRSPASVGVEADASGYYSMPDTAPMFRPVFGDPYLGILPLRAAGFNAETSFPVAPYRLVDVVSGDSGDASALRKSPDYKSFERQVLNPTRQTQIFNDNQKTELWPIPSIVDNAIGLTGATALAVTPQGLLSTFNDNSYTQWKSLRLANANNQLVELIEISDKLREALLSNQLFLVVSNPERVRLNANAELTISDWSFQLATSKWSEKETIMVIKFANMSLQYLIDRLTLWSSPGEFNQDPKTTQTKLKDIIKNAIARKNAGESDFDYFVNTVLDAAWNGVLFFNVNVPPASFPTQLKALTAGIDNSKFKAHHLGVNLAPVDFESGQIRINDSSLFGLIDYQDKEDLVYKNQDYDFKVLSLRVLFLNSDIASFVSQVELLVAALFGERSSLIDSLHGDNLILNGTWQRHNGEDSYSFSQQGENVFALASKVLDRAIVRRAQFVTDLRQTQADVTALFQLTGTIQFLPSAEFDLFSFGRDSDKSDSIGGLPFSNIVISMTYSQDITSDEKSFAFKANDAVLSGSGVVARSNSLFAKFPLALAGITQGNSSNSPPDLGFVIVDMPLTTGSLGDLWFGIEMGLSLGSQGALAGQGGFTASLLAAWAPSADSPNVALGLRLPGSDGKKSLTIEGPLKLTMQDIAMLFDAKEKAYLMRFQNIALSFLGVNFPPGGKTNVLLFGNPDPNSKTSTLGWYAAYKKDDEKKTNRDQSAAIFSEVKALALQPHSEDDR